MISQQLGDPEGGTVEIDYKRCSRLSLTIPSNTTSSLVEIQIEDDQFLEINELFTIVINRGDLPDGQNDFRATDIIISR